MQIMNLEQRKKGFQLWCVRHEKNILALDLLGQKVDYDK